MAKKETPSQRKIHKTMHEFKHGTLHSGSKKGPKVKSRKQAVAIAMSQGRKAGGKSPKNPDHSMTTRGKKIAKRGTPPKVTHRVDTEARYPKDRGMRGGMFSRRRSEALERKLEGQEM